ncbi:hypothetical protein FSS13T_00130 [Flavobacterium saliperosum S13]|uniref:Uncharacterized protein n=1 Tax=Flavobacterium saliperosum S13 TaxID=1341155 RepID=A0ABN0QKF9_9FLAO|nr:hypothetical protein FSS13T_00130 [Flavobacterium saliperosum S13]
MEKLFENNIILSNKLNNLSLNITNNNFTKFKINHNNFLGMELYDQK